MKSIEIWTCARVEKTPFLDDWRAGLMAVGTKGCVYRSVSLSKRARDFGMFSAIPLS